MRDDVPGLGYFARSQGMMTVLCTSGMLITRRNVDALMRGFDVFELSVDSLKPDLHDGLRGRKGALERTLAGLDMLVARRESRHAIEITSTVQDANYREMAQINSYFASQHILTAMQPLHQGLYGATTADSAAWAREGEAEWQRIVDGYKWYDGFSRSTLTPFYRQMPAFVRAPQSIRHKYTCFAGSYSFFVAPDGDVRLCEGLTQVQGNLSRSPLSQIWRGLNSLRYEVSGPNRQCDCWLLCTTPASLFFSKLFGWLPYPVRFKGGEHGHDQR
jgi:MoaA/NifB/PqqE/SkfB family radical SAM enzyme